MNKEIRTDLALETRESFEEDNVEIKGVEVSEIMRCNNQIKVTTVNIKTKKSASLMKKPVGKYITLEVEDLENSADMESIDKISGVVSEYIRELIPQKDKGKILVVGLGNRDATPDSLGPKTIDRIEITRNFEEIYGNNSWEISSIAPGVMAKTGMESVEIIKGIVEETTPDVVIAIDSLAARSVKRLNSTIQLTDTGINPGSGVGNHRHGLNSESIGCKVIAIGIPTVVDVATIIWDTMDSLIKMFSINKAYMELDESEQYEFIREIASPKMKALYVTPKDIDEDIQRMGIVLAKALNDIWKNRN